MEEEVEDFRLRASGFVYCGERPEVGKEFKERLEALCNEYDVHMFPAILQDYATAICDGRN